MKEELELEGIVCKEPIKRTSAFDVVIYDFILAIKNKDSFEYIPCRIAGIDFNKNVGDSIRISGTFKNYGDLHLFKVNKMK